MLSPVRDERPVLRTSPAGGTVGVSARKVDISAPADGETHHDPNDVLAAFAPNHRHIRPRTDVVPGQPKS
jgi:hypothetical protein